MTLVAPTEALTCANLWTELQSGPYASVIAPKLTSGDDQGIANILNDQAGAHNGPVAHSAISSADFENLVDPVELDTLTANQLTEYQIELTPGVVNVGGASIQAWINKNFTVANCPKTNAALAAVFTQTGSRSEVLFGTGIAVTAQQVNIARTTSGAGSF